MQVELYVILVGEGWGRGSRGVFRGPYHPICKVITICLPTVKCCKIEEIVSRYLKTCLFFVKTEIFVFYSRYFGTSPRLFIANLQASHKSRVLICNMTAPWERPGT